MDTNHTLGTKVGQIDVLLEKHGLKKTELRRAILSVLSKRQEPLDQADLLLSLSKTLDRVDRVSVYRNLLQLKEAGVLHEVDSNHYVFCSHECSSHAHLLFFCQKCHKHQEVKDHAKIADVMSALAALRFFGKTEPIFLKGVCTTCSAA
jgi:Fe2+ or Zn2+ uptake regulation protein